MSLDISRLWDLAHQVLIFSASLSGGSSPTEFDNPEKINLQTLTVYRHSQFTNHTYIQSTVYIFTL